MFKQNKEDYWLLTAMMRNNDALSAVKASIFTQHASEQECCSPRCK